MDQGPVLQLTTLLRAKSVLYVPFGRPESLPRHGLCGSISLRASRQLCIGGILAYRVMGASPLWCFASEGANDVFEAVGCPARGCYRVGPAHAPGLAWPCPPNPSRIRFQQVAQPKAALPALAALLLWQAGPLDEPSRRTGNRRRA